MASSNRRRARRTRGPAVVIMTALTLVSCTHASPKPDAARGQFNDQNRVDVRCLAHQTQLPGPAYTGGANADTGKILVMLHYYVANGSKPYCDGAHPSATDRTWAALFIRLGGEPRRVSGILSGG